MCLSYDFNDYLLVNLGSIISLTSITHVARSNSHELHQMDENIFLAFLKFESESKLGAMYLICKQTLR